MVYFLVAVAILAAAAGIFGRAGIEVNGQRRAWRNYYKFLGLTFGSWQAIPPTKGIVLKYFSSITRDTPGTIGSTANWNNSSSINAQVVIMLSVAGAQNGIVLRTLHLSELAAARTFAEEIAKELQVPVLDFLPAHLS